MTSLPCRVNDEDRFYVDGAYDPYFDSDYYADFGGMRNAHAQIHLCALTESCLKLMRQRSRATIFPFREFCF